MTLTPGNGGAQGKGGSVSGVGFNPAPDGTAGLADKTFEVQ